jgi:hypothetical protein
LPQTKATPNKGFLKSTFWLHFIPCHLVLTKIRNMNYDQTQNLSTDSSHLLKDTDSCDVIIKVGKKPNFKKFKAHSHILSSKSAYFEKAFSAQWARKEDGFFISNQPNISPGVFEILIK